MQTLFSPAGEAAMHEALSLRPLLALDFDGTLAPIVGDPSAARASARTAEVLSRLVRQLPVAIVTGRAVADVVGRLGFNPQFVVGNHGAEGLPGTDLRDLPPELDLWRARIMGDFRAQLEQAGVMIEDKGHSMSFHYRHAPDREAARDAIHAAIRALQPAPRVIGGKCVINLLPADAPDKFRAVSTLLRISACGSVIFAGDDLTDDVVFEHAPAHWLTIRVDEKPGSRARFSLSGQHQVLSFLERLEAMTATSMLSPD
ncbi:trehalose-phosphatase [Uliginosibacterium paludis]|uniref:Trehalose 6-phosphate phosphatase n=1 Tax=Uliginosibacterium paludis TaxID=1615952 RepID=A0ABV2CSM3_9RHOO